MKSLRIAVVFVAGILRLVVVTYITDRISSVCTVPEDVSAHMLLVLESSVLLYAEHEVVPSI